MLLGKQLAAHARPSNMAAGGDAAPMEVTRRHARHEVLLRAACTRAWARERAVHNSRLPRSTQADLYQAAWRPRGGLVALHGDQPAAQETAAIGMKLAS